MDYLNFLDLGVLTC